MKSLEDTLLSSHAILSPLPLDKTPRTDFHILQGCLFSLTFMGKTLIKYSSLIIIIVSLKMDL